MNPLIWTTELPPRAGWYWHRRAGVERCVVRVTYDLMLPTLVVQWAGLTRWRTVSELGGEWAGPITEPQEP